MLRSIAAGLVFAAAIAHADMPNMLANPGFEEIAGDLPRSWQAPNGLDDAAVDAEVAHGGERSARFDGDGVARGARQTLTGLEGRPFTVSAWVRAEGMQLSGDSHAFLYVHVLYRDEPYSAATHGYHRIEPGTFDWHRVRVRVDPNPAHQIEKIYVTCTARLAGGTLWYDDVELVESVLGSAAALMGEHLQWLNEALAATGEQGADVAGAQQVAAEASRLLELLRAEAAAGPVVDGEQRLASISERVGSALAPLSAEARAAFWQVASPTTDREIRAIYHGGGLTLEQVNSVLDRLHRIGANTMYPSLGGWHMVTYPSQLAPTLPAWQGSDGRNILAQEARKRGVRIIPYLAFYHDITPGDPMRDDLPSGFLAQRHPLDPKRDRLFPAPSHPEVREYLVKLAVEAMTVIDPDGLGLDYIRYPDGRAVCTCERCREQVRERYGFDVLDGDPWADPERSAALQEWRAEHITQTVREVAEAVHQAKPDAIVMAHCFVDPDYARRQCGQNWAGFAQYLDLITTMNYGKNGSDAGLVGKQAGAVGESCLFVPAIGGMPDQHAAAGPRDWIERIALARRYGQGVAIYAWGYISPETEELLSNGPFREPAQWPE